MNCTYHGTIEGGSNTFLLYWFLHFRAGVEGQGKIERERVHSFFFFFAVCFAKEHREIDIKSWGGREGREIALVLSENKERKESCKLHVPPVQHTSERECNATPFLL